METTSTKKTIIKFLKFLKHFTTKILNGKMYDSSEGERIFHKLEIRKKIKSLMKSKETWNQFSTYFLNKQSRKQYLPHVLNPRKHLYFLMKYKVKSLF